MVRPSIVDDLPAWIRDEYSPRMWRSDAFCQRCGAKLWRRYHPMLFLLCLL